MEEKTRDELIDLIRLGKVEYSDLTEDMKNDWCVVTALVELGKVEYSELTEDMKNDWCVVTALVELGKVEYSELTEDMKNDWRVILAIHKKFWDDLKKLSDLIKEKKAPKADDDGGVGR